MAAINRNDWISLYKSASILHFQSFEKKVSAVSELLISFELFWSISKLHEKQLQWTKTISMNKVRPKNFLNVLKNGDSGNIMKALIQLKNRLLSIENTFANDRYSNGKDPWHSFPNISTLNVHDNMWFGSIDNDSYRFWF